MHRVRTLRTTIAHSCGQEGRRGCYFTSPPWALARRARTLLSRLPLHPHSTKPARPTCGWAPTQPGRPPMPPPGSRPPWRPPARRYAQCMRVCTCVLMRGCGGRSVYRRRRSDFASWPHAPLHHALAAWAGSAGPVRGCRIWILVGGCARVRVLGGPCPACAGGQLACTVGRSCCTQVRA